MGKVKYYYNPRTLSYQEVNLSFKQKVLKLFGFLSASFVMGLGLIMMAFYFIDSPKEKLLKNEIDVLSHQYDVITEEMKEMDMVLEELEKRDDNIYRVITESEPIPKNIRRMGVGGSDPYAEFKQFENNELLVSTNSKLDELKRKLYIQSKSFSELVKLVKDKQKMLASIPAIQPITNKDLSRLTSGYGYRIDPIYKTKKFHQGMDFAAPNGTPIYATGDGKIKSVKRMRRSYGYHVIIDHGYGYETLYAHMKKFNVKKGDKVKRGQVIGFVGSTGKSTAPHLHYEVIKKDHKINPVYFMHNDLPQEQFEKLIEMASTTNQSFD